MTKIQLMNSLIMNLHAQENQGVDEIFIQKSNAQLLWNGIKYQINLKMNESCDNRLNLYHIIWDHQKKSEICFKDDSEEFLLSEKLFGNIDEEKIINRINESEEIENSRKLLIIDYLKNRKIKNNKKIFFDIEKNRELIYAKSFLHDANDTSSIINRINILIIEENYIGAEDLILKLFKMKKEKLILQLNWYYFRNKNHSNIFDFYENLKKKLEKKIKKINHNFEIYFKLFLDNPTSMEELDFEKINLNKFLILALDCPKESNSNIVVLRKCLIDQITEESSDLIIYKLRQLGDDSIDNLWRF